MKSNRFFQQTASLCFAFFLILLANTQSFAQNNDCMNRTYTIGGWGSPGDNPPQIQYLNANFDSAFPNDMVLGCPTGNTLTLTSAQAVRNFLPAGGTSAPLSGDFVDPTGFSNTLVSQLVAATLSVTFDAYDANYSSSNVSLGNYYIMDTASPFYLMTVNQVIDLANQFIGGCGSSQLIANQYTASQYTNALDKINQSYHEGKVNTGYLNCCKLKIKVSFAPIDCYNGTTTVTVSYENGSSTTTGAGTFTVGAGTYTYTVKDGDCSDSKTITIENPTPVTISSNITKKINCFGETADVTLDFSGGTSGVYDIYWNGVLVSDNDADGIHIITNVAGNATYTYAATDSKNCGPAEGSIFVPSPTELKISAIPGEILCHGSKTSVKIIAVGGTAPYDLYFDGSLVSDNDADGEFTVENVGAGSHNYSVTDNNGCSKSGEAFTLNEPTQVDINALPGTIKCFGDLTSVTLTASGGTAPYDIYWNGTLVSDDDADGTFVVTNVAAGNYSYSVKDHNGCTIAKDGLVISQPALLTISAISTEVLCNGGTSMVTVKAEGGTAPYDIYWNGALVSENDADGIFNITVPARATAYAFSVKDENGCSQNGNILITEPAPIVLTAPNATVICVGGTATVTATVSGGTSPYSVTWWNGTSQVGTGLTVDLPVGSYIVKVTDAKGCTKETSVEVKQQTCVGFTTVTQGGWGAKASGNNWGVYRDRNFAAAFPNGVTIGGGDRWLKLTSAKAVELFLPSGGTPRALNVGTLTNPTEKSYGNTLAGQVVALTLSVRFDLANPSFSVSTTHLEDLIVVSGTFAGMTVKDLLIEANKVLGGLPSNYTADQINGIISSINENYDGGKMNNGVLACPCPTTMASATSVSAKPAVAAQPESKMVLYPNPTKGDINLKFDADSGSAITVQLYDVSGKMIADISRSASRNGNQVTVAYSNYNLSEGMYVVRVKTSKEEKTFKLIVRK